MSLFFKDPIVQIIDELNAKNVTTLKRPLAITDLLFTEVSSNSTTGAREVNAKPAPGAPYFGTIKHPGVTYKRYVGEKMFLVPPRVWAVAGESITDLINRFTTLYNLPAFTLEPSAGDTVNPYDLPKSYHGQTLQPLGDWLTTTLTITFRADSLGWVGSIPITIYNSAKDLGKIINSTAQDSLVYPDNTLGATGSMASLTYPINFELPNTAQATLVTRGSKLSSSSTDDTVQAIINQILAFYEFSAPEDVRTSLESTIPGSTVVTTNLADSAQTDKQVILQMTSPSGPTPMFIGKIFINNPTFA